MNCRVIPNGFACGSFPRQKACAWCTKPGTKLCDQRMPGGRTCDASMCEDHAYNAGRKDFCPHHAGNHNGTGGAE